MLNKVKLALRINHSFLDSALNDQISECRADMIRAGVPADIAEDDTNILVSGCILTFCKFKNATKRIQSVIGNLIRTN